MEQYQLLENFRAPLWPDGWEDPALPSLHLNDVLCDVNIYLVLHLLSNWLSHSTLQFPGSREEAGLHTQQGWTLWTLVSSFYTFLHMFWFCLLSTNHEVHINSLFLGKLEFVDLKGCYFMFGFSDFIKHEKRNNFHYSIRLPSKMSWMKFFAALAWQWHAMHMSPGLHDSSSFIFLSLLIERIKINFFMQPQNECIFDTKYSPLLFNLSQVLIGGV